MKLTEKKRQSIIEAAIADFRDHGFAGANITRIAKLAEVSIRTLYKHFESKDSNSHFYNLMQYHTFLVTHSSGLSITLCRI